MHKFLIRIGTRASPLALAQAREAQQGLMIAHGFSERDIALIPFTTSGDRLLGKPPADSGVKGLFTKEIETALLQKHIDIAVHSMKDMPAQLSADLKIGAVLPREDARDCLISQHFTSLMQLPEGAIVGTSSVRRTAQIKRLRPDIRIVAYRGNVGTRLEKLKSGNVCATILACAGLNRLKLQSKLATPIATDIMLPAMAQGAIGLEIRENDEKMEDLIAPLNDRSTELAIGCERAFLKYLDGSCRTPMAGLAVISGETLSFTGQLYSLDGTQLFEATQTGNSADAIIIGEQAGKIVKDQQKN